VIFGIVPSGLLSGNYYNGRGASDIDALKTGKTTSHSVRTSQGRSYFRIKKATGREHIICECLLYDSQ
jgi:hypothetical protein